MQSTKGRSLCSLMMRLPLDCHQEIRVKYLYHIPAPIFVQYNALCIPWGPNALTCLRGILGVGIGIYLRDHCNAWVAPVFLVAWLSDAVDGWWARTCHLTSAWGAILDPIADKAMTLSIVSALALHHVVPYWFLYFMLAKELLLVLGGIYLVQRKPYAFTGARFWGKSAMFFQSMLIFFGILQVQYAWKSGAFYTLYPACVWGVAILHGIALLSYLVHAHNKDHNHDIR